MVRWKNEISYLTPVPRRGAAAASTGCRAPATLVGLESRRASSATSTSSRTRSASIATDTPATPAGRNDLDGDFGVDAKWGITQELVADFTYNTDFAQVEDDEAAGEPDAVQRCCFPRSATSSSKGRSSSTSAASAAAAAARPGTSSAGSGGRADNAPMIFYSRRIGLRTARAVPIIGGGRMLGPRPGQWQRRRAQHHADRGRRRSRRRAHQLHGAAGATATSCAAAASAPSSPRGRLDRGTAGRHELAYGVDAHLQRSIAERLRHRLLSPRPRTPAASGDDLSYRGAVRLERRPLRPPARSPRSSATTSTRRSASCARTDVPPHLRPARFSPRPRNMPASASASTTAASTTSPTTTGARSRSREAHGAFRIELQTAATGPRRVLASLRAIVDAVRGGATGVASRSATTTSASARAAYSSGSSALSRHRHASTSAASTTAR